MTGQPPKRPDDVPADAIWDDRWREWGHGEMKDGKKQGPWRFWREDGSLAEESVWQAGHIEDKARKRFHDDGSLASMSEYEEGRLRRITLYRSKKKTREPNLQGRPKSVREADLVFGHDRWQTTQRFRDKEGRDVDLHGKLVPPKPERVSDVAYFNSEIGLWLAGEWRNASGETIRRGLYRYWDDSGALVRLEYYTTTGQCTGCLDVRGTGEQRAFGNPLVAAARAKDDAALVTCIELGAATLPNTDWHASYEGLSELALRLAKLESTGSSIDDARIVPPARRDAPADALWVAGLDRWVRGARDKNAVAIGTWDLWLGHHEEVDFENGRRTQLRVYVDGKARRWVFYDRDGNELRSRFWDAAGLHEQLARDGAKIERLYFGEGEGLRWERVTKGYTAQEQVFYRDGTIKAEGQRDVTKSGESGRMIGTWRIAEPSGALALEIDLTKAPWKAFARREADEVADLARMSKLPETWVNTVTPKKLDLAMGWRLEAMVHGSPDLALEAYRRILHDTWDKGTITEAAARVTPILLRMLDEPSTSKPHVFDLLVRYAEALGGVGEPARRGKQGKWLRPMQTAFTDARAHALELCS